MLLADSEVMESYPPLLEQRRQVIEMKARYLEATLLEAQRLARTPAVPRPVRLEVLMCTPIPRVVPSMDGADASSAEDPAAGGEAR